jgi:hypothetical protein
MAGRPGALPVRHRLRPGRGPSGRPASRSGKPVRNGAGPDNSRGGGEGLTERAVARTRGSARRTHAGGGGRTGLALLRQVRAEETVSGRKKPSDPTRPRHTRQRAARPPAASGGPSAHGRAPPIPARFGPDWSDPRPANAYRARHIGPAAAPDGGGGPSGRPVSRSRMPAREPVQEAGSERGRAPRFAAQRKRGGASEADRPPCAAPFRSRAAATQRGVGGLGPTEGAVPRTRASGPDPAVAGAPADGDSDHPWWDRADQPGRPGRQCKGGVARRLHPAALRGARAGWSAGSLAVGTRAGVGRGAGPA